MESRDNGERLATEHRFETMANFNPAVPTLGCSRSRVPSLSVSPRRPPKTTPRRSATATTVADSPVSAPYFLLRPTPRGLADTACATPSNQAAAAAVDAAARLGSFTISRPPQPPPARPPPRRSPNLSKSVTSRGTGSSAPHSRAAHTPIGTPTVLTSKDAFDEASHYPLQLPFRSVKGVGGTSLSFSASPFAQEGVNMKVSQIDKALAHHVEHAVVRSGMGVRAPRLRAPRPGPSSGPGQGPGAVPDKVRGKVPGSGLGGVSGRSPNANSRARARVRVRQTPAGGKSMAYEKGALSLVGSRAVPTYQHSPGEAMEMMKAAIRFLRQSRRVLNYASELTLPAEKVVGEDMFDRRGASRVIEGNGGSRGASEGGGGSSGESGARSSGSSGSEFSHNNESGEFGDGRYDGGSGGDDVDSSTANIGAANSGTKTPGTITPGTPSVASAASHYEIAAHHPDDPVAAAIDAARYAAQDATGCDHACFVRASRAYPAYTLEVSSRPWSSNRRATARSSPNNKIETTDGKLGAAVNTFVCGCPHARGGNCGGNGGGSGGGASSRDHGEWECCRNHYGGGNATMLLEVLKRVVAGGVTLNISGPEHEAFANLRRSDARRPPVVRGGAVIPATDILVRQGGESWDTALAVPVCDSCGNVNGVIILWDKFDQTDGSPVPFGRMDEICVNHIALKLAMALRGDTVTVASQTSMDETRWVQLKAESDVSRALRDDLPAAVGASRLPASITPNLPIPQMVQGVVQRAVRVVSAIARSVLQVSGVLVFLPTNVLPPTGCATVAETAGDNSVTGHQTHQQPSPPLSCWAAVKRSYSHRDEGVAPPGDDVGNDANSAGGGGGGGGRFVPVQPQALLMLCGKNGSGDVGEARDLLARGINIDEQDKNGQTALMKAVLYGRVEVVKELVRAGATLDAVMPAWFTQGMGIQFYFGGTSLLIVVGVAMDTVQQVESQLVMRNYEGFMKRGRIRGRKG